MKSIAFYKGREHTWYMFGRDPEKPEGIIDTNQFMVVSGGQALLVEPGGIETFSSTLAAVLHHVSVDGITGLFASHQDPDIISSLGLWDRALPEAKLHAPGLWEGFIRHFGCQTIEYCSIPDEGGEIRLGNVTLEVVPAHYLHASSNFHLYDPKARILMSGDIGAAIEPEGAPLFVEDFDAHIPKMKYFHQRWMPSNEAKNDWIRRVRELDIEVMVPQHGRAFRGADVGRFLDWFEALQVGIAIS